MINTVILKFGPDPLIHVFHTDFEDSLSLSLSLSKDVVVDEILILSLTPSREGRFSFMSSSLISVKRY